MDNITIARHLTAEAHALAAQHGNLFRVRAYRRAAETVRGLDRPVEEILTLEGRKALKDLPGIGPSLSVKIETLVHTGRFANLNDAEPTLVAH